MRVGTPRRTNEGRARKINALLSRISVRGKTYKYDNHYLWEYFKAKHPEVVKRLFRYAHLGYDGCLTAALVEFRHLRSPGALAWMARCVGCLTSRFRVPKQRGEEPLPPAVLEDEQPKARHHPKPQSKRGGWTKMPSHVPGWLEAKRQRATIPTFKRGVGSGYAFCRGRGNHLVVFNGKSSTVNGSVMTSQEAYDFCNSILPKSERAKFYARIRRTTPARLRELAPSSRRRCLLIKFYNTVTRQRLWACFSQVCEQPGCDRLAVYHFASYHGGLLCTQHEHMYALGIQIRKGKCPVRGIRQIAGFSRRQPTYAYSRTKPRVPKVFRGHAHGLGIRKFLRSIDPRRRNIDLALLRRRLFILGRATVPGIGELIEQVQYSKIVDLLCPRVLFERPAAPETIVASDYLDNMLVPRQQGRNLSGRLQRGIAWVLRGTPQPIPRTVNELNLVLRLRGVVLDAGNPESSAASGPAFVPQDGYELSDSFLLRVARMPNPVGRSLVGGSALADVDTDAAFIDAMLSERGRGSVVGAFRSYYLDDFICCDTYLASETNYLFAHGLVALYPHCSTRPWRRIRRFAFLRSPLMRLSHIRFMTLLRLWYHHPRARLSRDRVGTCRRCSLRNRALDDCEFLNGCLGGLPLLTNSLLVFRETGWRRRQLAIALNFGCVRVWLDYLSGRRHELAIPPVGVFWAFPEYRDALSKLSDLTVMLNRAALIALGKLDSAGNLPLP